MNDPLPIRRCICHNRSFSELKALADEAGWTELEQLTRSTGCGSGCKLCRPYLERMLSTGETAFALLPPSVPIPHE